MMWGNKCEKSSSPFLEASQSRCFLRDSPSEFKLNYDQYLQLQRLLYSICNDDHLRHKTVQDYQQIAEEIGQIRIDPAFAL